MNGRHTGSCTTRTSKGFYEAKIIELGNLVGSNVTRRNGMSGDGKITAMTDVAKALEDMGKAACESVFAIDLSELEKRLAICCDYRSALASGFGAARGYFERLPNVFGTFGRPARLRRERPDLPRSPFCRFAPSSPTRGEEESEPSLTALRNASSTARSTSD